MQVFEGVGFGCFVPSIVFFMFSRIFNMCFLSLSVMFIVIVLGPGITSMAVFTGLL